MLKISVFPYFFPLAVKKASDALTSEAHFLCVDHVARAISQAWGFRRIRPLFTAALSWGKPLYIHNREYTRFRFSGRGIPY